ncbi:MAG TPA: hypothetical protein VN429_07020 [Methanospirillum sp.]|uniref:hypothetical protein n=1 Tax=Methanospirillum sp. TaxID=45200 RepID=UPI002C2FE835|nr:hypothetical protein [Methanospirillum sp.]HWQ64153.1 hypothetical protein [Methanospirillum sp.]
MNLLLISRPGIPLLRSLRESETAWDAIRFYGPVSLSIGVYIPVSTLAGAISLASDLKYFLKKYTTDHLFQIKPGVYYTAALTRSRYLTRSDDMSEDWPFKLVYWVENLGRVIRVKKEDWNSEEILYLTSETGENRANPICDNAELPGGYLLEVWCTKPEFEIV